MQVSECKITYDGHMYVPYPTSRLPELVGKVLVNRESNEHTLVINAYIDDGFIKCMLGNGNLHSSVFLFTKYNYRDGSPVGMML